MSDSIKKQLPGTGNRPIYKAGTVIRNTRGTKEVNPGGGYINDDVIEAVLEWNAVQQQNNQQEQQEQPISDNGSYSKTVTTTPVQDSMSRRLGGFVARNVAGALFGTGGAYRDVARMFPAGGRNLGYTENVEYTGSEPSTSSTIRGRNAREAAQVAKDISESKDANKQIEKTLTGERADRSKLVKDMSDLKNSVMKIERLVDTLVNSNTNDPTGEKDKKKAPTLLESAGDILRGLVTAVTSAVAGVIPTIARAFGGLVPAIGTILRTGLGALFSGPVLAAVIGAGALAAIGTAIYRALQMSPEERARIQAAANAQAGAGVDSLSERERVGAGGPGRVVARNMAAEYETSNEQLGGIQDTLSRPEAGETEEQKAQREAADNALREAEQRGLGAGGRVTVPSEAATYLQERSQREASRSGAPGSAMDAEMDFMRSAERATPGSDMDQEMSFMQGAERARENYRQEINLAGTAATNQARRTNPEGVRAIEDAARAMGQYRTLRGGVLNAEGQAVELILTGNRRVPVTTATGTQSTTPAPEAPPEPAGSLEPDNAGLGLAPSEDNRASQITAGAGQPTVVVVPPGAPAQSPAPAQSTPPQTSGGGSRRASNALRRASHPERPSDIASPAATR